MIDPSIPSGALELLRAQGLRPRKRWGQNFLVDRGSLDRIADGASLAPSDHVLEIGPGLGALTRSLAARSAQVHAVEIDPLLEPILQATVGELPNVSVTIQDFLDLDLGAFLADRLGDRRGVVVANIPYYITTPIIERLLDHKAMIRRIVLLVQLEVAQRLAAQAGADAYGSLSVYVQYHAEVRILGKVSRRVFLPPPEVDSAVISLELRDHGAVDVADEELLFRLVRAAFSQRRKTVANAIAAGMSCPREIAGAALEAAGIDPGARGETLGLPDYARLCNAWPTVS